MVDIRFPTALQMMLTLAYAEKQGHAQMTSAQLAHGLGSTASLVRRILVPLGRDGLVKSSFGKTGGVRLGRPASHIRLSDIYAAVTGDKQLLAGRRDIPHLCDVSSHVEVFFRGIACDAERAVLEVLGERTLEGSLDELLALKPVRRRRPNAVALRKPSRSVNV